jgi:hypothetical protein
MTVAEIEQCGARMGGKLQKAKDELYKSKDRINYGADLCGQTKRNEADLKGTGTVEIWNGAV